jgi:hypothetical protein
MRTADWNDPRLREIGERQAADAYEMAAELDTYGADASVLLLRKGAWQPRRPHQVCIPTAFADALMAILLSLPRPRGATGRRRNWSPVAVQNSINRGMSQRAAAKQEAERTGVPAKTIERGMQLRRNPPQTTKNKSAKKGRRTP